MRIRAIAGLLGLALVAAGCQAQPDYPQLGIARIGEQIQLFVPLCGEHNVRRVSVYSDVAGRPNDDPDLIWQGTDPTRDSVRFGFVTVGVDSDFSDVIGAGQVMPPRPVFEVLLTGGGAAVGLTIAADDGRIPRYPAGADPAHVLYLTDLREPRAKRLSPTGIQQRVNC